MDDVPILPDVLCPGLKVVFCGTAAGSQSARRQAYYAGPGNRFWPVLHQIGLTDVRVDPQHYRGVIGYGIGLTDVCKTHAGMDRELPTGAFTPGELEEKVARFRPGTIAFNGKKAAQIALNVKQGRQLDFGRQPELFSGSVVWVLPSTSRAANGHWSIDPWKALAESLHDI